MVITPFSVALGLRRRRLPKSFYGCAQLNGITDKFINQIHLADCLDVLKELPDNSIDLIVTDPPYAIGFMQSHWDQALPSIDIWRECLRVLKPGAFAFIMCIPRQDCLGRMLILLQDAGFFLSYSSLYWTYATGLPKSMNIAKAIDKRLGVERTVVGKRKAHDIRKNSLLEASQPHLKKESSTFEYEYTIATSEEAKKMDGSFAGYQPKPAIEIIIVAMKPLQEDDKEKMQLDFVQLREIKHLLVEGRYAYSD